MAKRIVGSNGTVKRIHSDHGDVPPHEAHEGHSMAQSPGSEEFLGHHHPNPILGNGPADVVKKDDDGDEFMDNPKGYA